ncbi:MAG: hypothetical protein ACJ76I_12750 [Gaiellaceae bacterium]
MKLVVVAATALVIAAGAHAATSYVPLPSPVAPLSASPPLGGGATATTERIRHRIAARTSVVVSLDPAGAPFAVTATQHLDVRVKGDYFFTIGAPVLDVEAAAGSQATPGLRASSILWAGFDPGRRRLVARASLDPLAVSSSLPLRIEVANGRTALVNATRIAVTSYTADATRGRLIDYLRQLRRDLAAGRTPVAGNAYATSKPQSAQVVVRAPLVVEGTVGGRAVRATLVGRLVVPAVGAVRLTVRPSNRLGFGDLSRLSGRRLLALANRLTLQTARTRQYETFLGNPDPTGSNETTYLYRSAKRPPPPVAAAGPPHGRSWATTLSIAAALALAAFLALVAWTRA